MTPRGTGDRTVERGPVARGRVEDIPLLVVTLSAGIVFVAGWPADSVYLLGMILAMDLTFQGAMAIGCRFALEKLAK